ncbi:hypothetical protein AAVH_36274 [Aphelenchoides avenae]|nr:hypothetical protein AAVH_36274 [Aphelenchus avenae]
MSKALLYLTALSALVVAANAGALGGILAGLLDGLKEPPKESLLSFVPPALKPFLPEAVKEKLAELDTGDLKALKVMAKKYYIYDDLKQILAELEDKSPPLAKIVKKLLGLGQDKVDLIKSLLLSESKDFFKDLAKQGKDALKKVVETYENLSDAAKDNLKETFPLAATVLEDPTFQKVANKIIYS